MIKLYAAESHQLLNKCLKTIYQVFQFEIRIKYNQAFLVILL